MSAATDLAPPVWGEPAYLDPTTGRLVTPAAPVAIVPETVPARQVPTRCQSDRTAPVEAVMLIAVLLFLSVVLVALRLLGAL